MTGTVKWFNPRRGYGFITGDDGKDYFVHFSDLVMDGFKRVKDNDRVSFEIGTTEEGREKAAKVAVVA